MDLNQIIDLLNADLAREYRAALMYRAHAAMLSGPYFAFVEVLYEHADDEMGHAKRLSEHINYLGGIPTAIESAPDIAFGNIATLKLDFAGEKDAEARYTERIGQCLAAAMFGTAKILMDILQDEQEHANDLQSILTIEAGAI